MKIWLSLLLLAYINWSMLLVTKVSAKNNNETKGPFRTVLVSVRHCENTTHPMEKDSPILINMWTINTNSKDRLLSYNITVLRETKQVRLKVKAFTWGDGKWKLKHSIIARSCHGMLMDLIRRAIGFKLFDSSKCAYIKGTFTVDGININTYTHMLYSTMEYGRILYQCEMYVGLSSFYCWEFIMKIEPGPFRAVLVSVFDCKNTTYPLQKDPPLVINIWTVSSSSRDRLLSYNITVLRETKQVRLNVKRFTWEDGKWKLKHSMKSWSCHGMLINVVARTIGFKLFDTSKCAYQKGTFTVDGMNINTLIHIIASKMEYGRILYQSEMNVGLYVLLLGIHN